MGIRSKAAVSLHGAVDQVADAAAPASQWLEERRELLGKYVTAHPLQSLALALAAGYLLGRLTR
jgi:ElaB/YqjD/DUF883 family membrane-anchored ribosome-binding protein